MPEPASADAARAQLAELTVATPQPMTSYSRSKFPQRACVPGVASQVGL
ncbi:hypothetical protein ACFXKG_38910 [Streptomyces sp. NPDC059255]